MKLKFISYISWLFALTAMSCSSQGDEVKIAPPTARMVYINGSPTLAKNVEVYTGKTAIYGNDNRKGNLGLAGVSTVNPVTDAVIRLRLTNYAQDLIKKDVKLEDYKYYSSLIANTDPVSNDTASTVGVIFTQDDMTKPAENKIKIRFINLAVGSPSIDFYAYQVGIPVTPDALVSNKSYLQASDKNFSVVANDVSDLTPWGFLDLDVPFVVGGTPYTFEIREAGTASTTVPKVTLNFKVTAGRFYTVLFTGLEAGVTKPVKTARPLAVNVIEYPFPNY